MLNRRIVEQLEIQNEVVTPNYIEIKCDGCNNKTSYFQNRKVYSSQKNEYLYCCCNCGEVIWVKKSIALINEVPDWAMIIYLATSTKI